jgi:hypothetical protein
MIRIPLIILLGAVLSLAQAPVASNPVAPDTAAERPDPVKIAQQFGPLFQAVKNSPVLLGDLDGDGAEDAVIVATAENPLIDAEKFQFKVFDPLSASFGFSNPRETSQFNLEGGGAPRYVLVVQSWRAPKLKFVLINVPFQKLALGRVLVKKKVYPAILAIEETGDKSAVYWDGKKWKWREDGIATQ